VVGGIMERTAYKHKGPKKKPPGPNRAWAVVLNKKMLNGEYSGDIEDFLEKALDLAEKRGADWAMRKVKLNYVLEPRLRTPRKKLV